LLPPLPGLQSLTRLFGVEKAHERGRAMQETTYKGHLIKYHCSSDKWVAIVAFAKARSWAAS
jgi:hypothetical protein